MRWKRENSTSKRGCNLINAGSARKRRQRRERTTTRKNPIGLATCRAVGLAEAEARQRSTNTNHFSRARSTHCTRKDASSGLDEKDLSNPSDVQKPKPSPNARPLITLASVRFFLTCWVASRTRSSREPSSSNFHPTIRAFGKRSRRFAITFGFGASSTDNVSFSLPI